MALSALCPGEGVKPATPWPLGSTLSRTVLFFPHCSWKRQSPEGSVQATDSLCHHPHQAGLIMKEREAETMSASSHSELLRLR